MYEFKEKFLKILPVDSNTSTVRNLHDVDEERRREAAQVFRSRHHVSHEDTISVNLPPPTEFEDVSQEIGRVETPSLVRTTSSGCC